MRVRLKKKSKRGKTYACTTCGKPIKPGTEYYEWKFRYGGFRRQHQAHGYPRRSQLTQSKLGSVYDAVDDAEETIAKATSAEDIGAALRLVSETVDDVKQEYEDAAEAMGSAGESGISRERADELESFSDALDAAADEIESETWEQDDDKADEAGKAISEDEETEEEWLGGLREQATDALGELSL